MRRVRISTALAAFILAPAVICQAPKALELSGDYPLAHDPSIAKAGSTYYVYTTGVARDEGQFPMRCSKDLLTWRRCGHVFD